MEVENLAAVAAEGVDLANLATKTSIEEAISSGGRKSLPPIVPVAWQDLVL